MKKEKFRKILAIRDYNLKKEDEFPKNPNNITKDELHDHFDLDEDGKVTLDEYAEHINFHCDNPEILDEELENAEYEKGFKYKKGGKIKKAKTWKEKYNKKYGNELNASNSLSQIAEDTGVSKKGIQQIYNKGIGAYKTNPSSVRPNVKSKEQWAQARVYSAVMGGKASKVDKKELSMEKGGMTEKLSAIKEMMAKEKVNYAKGGEIDKNLTYKGDVVGYRGDSKRPQFLGKISIPKNSTPKSIIELAKSKFKRTWYVEVSKDGEYLYEITDDTYYDPNNSSANEYPMIKSYAKGGEIDVKIKDWYTTNYSTDDLGEELNKTNTFEDLYNSLNKGDDVYNTMGVGDSLIRERLFEHLAKIKGVPYNFIYQKWLGQGMITDEEIKSMYAKGGEVKKSEKYGSEYKKEDGKLLFRPINTKEDWSEVSDEAFNKEERKDFDKEMNRIFKKGGMVDYDEVKEEVLDKYGYTIQDFNKGNMNRQEAQKILKETNELYMKRAKPQFKDLGMQKFEKGGSVEEVYLVQVEWKQLNDKGLGKFILTESDVERLEDDYGSTFYFEIYDDSDEKPISFTKMKNILDKAMDDKGLTESYFAKGGKTNTKISNLVTVGAIEEPLKELEKIGKLKLEYLYNQLKISKNILDNSIGKDDRIMNSVRYDSIQKLIDNILIK